MDKNTLKNKIVTANLAYRNGNAIISDQEFDDLCDEYSNLISESEWNEFRNSLHENSGKIIHPYIMGSLNKIKYEEPETIKTFINKHVSNKLNVSAKCDGISARLHYSNGLLEVSDCSTRGNGEKGESLADKIEFVKYIPKNIPFTDDIDIRGELVIFKSDFEILNDKNEFKNPRNCVAGLINRKDFDISEISNISFIAYTILGNKFPKEKQFKLLKDFGFNVAFNENISLADAKSDSIVEKLFELASIEHDYECDGLVISDSEYLNEDKYRPDAQVAFKINQQVGMTTLIDVDWGMPSKDGKLVPVGILEPIELGGVLVSRCTLHNLDFIENNNLKYGCKIKIMRSGDVIPKLIDVVEIPDEAVEIEYPEICPSCGSKIVRINQELFCENDECHHKKLEEMTMFVRKIGIKNVSFATIKNWDIDSFEKLLAFKPNPKYKIDVKFNDDLNSILFSMSEKQLVCSMNFKGLSETLLEKIIDYYKLENIKFNLTDLANLPIKQGYPLGISNLFFDRFINGAERVFKNVNLIVSDPRYIGSANIEAVKKEYIGSICVTGSLNFGSRSKFLKMAEEHGYESKGGVSKGLTYLITNDTTSGSSKNKKAKELGIKVISEEEFMNILKNNESTTSEFSLNDL